MLKVNRSTFISSHLSSLTWTRRGDMIDTSYDSERQAGLSSAYLVRVGLSSLVHSFRLYTQHLTCLPRFLPPSRVPCSTVLARLLWREMWPNHASFLLFIISAREYGMETSNEKSKVMVNSGDNTTVHSIVA